MTDREPIRRGDYRVARIGAATALTATLVLLLIADVFVPDYHVEPTILVGLLSAIATLLGLELHDIWRGES